MPILTPAYPCDNSTYNVNQATFRILCQEIDRGHQLLSEHNSSADPFEALMTPIDIFADYRHFIFVRCSSTPNKVERWAAAVQSKLRLFVLDILAKYPMGQGAGLLSLRVLDRIIEANDSSDSKLNERPSSFMVIGVQTAPKTQLNLADATAKFIATCHGQILPRDITTDFVTVEYLRSKDLPKSLISTKRKPVDLGDCEIPPAKRARLL